METPAQRHLDSKGEYLWLPFQNESPAMTKTQRGIIDYIEYINNDEELRIVDYKKSKNDNDLESLYFYANLLGDFSK